MKQQTFIHQFAKDGYNSLPEPTPSIHEIWIDDLHLNEEVLDWSEDEAQQILRYIRAVNSLRIIKEETQGVSQGVWEQTEDQLLRPV